MINDTFLDDGELFLDGTHDSIGVSAESDTVTLPKSKYELVKNVLKTTHEHLGRVVELLEEGKDMSEDEIARLAGSLGETRRQVDEASDSRVLEGVFTGDAMLAHDGTAYPIPPNYASKSKLVEVDIMKLTILRNGEMRYKQIGPVERETVSGVLVKDGDRYYLIAGSKKWRLLTASVTFHKAEPGAEVVGIVPKGGVCKWAAVETILKS